MMDEIICNIIVIFQITSFKKNHALIWNNPLYDLYVLIIRFYQL